MKAKWLTTLALMFFVALATTDCRPLYIPRVWTKYVLDKSLPDREIIFLTKWRGNELGFINSDGTGLDYVRAYYVPNIFDNNKELPGFIYLTWSSDGNSLFESTYGYPTATQIQVNKDGATEYSLGGDIEFIGKHHAPVAVIPGTQQAIFVGLDRKTEQDVVSILELDKAPVVLFSSPHPSYIEIGLNPLCGKDTIVFTQFSVGGMIFYNLKNKTQKTLLHEDLSGGIAIYPSCSPTGEWVAYTSIGGIHLVRPDGSENKQVDTFYGTGLLVSEEEIPAVSWSPDGKWIVYHKQQCEDEASCRSTKFNPSIYKLNIETGEKVKLVDIGLFPYWRWPHYELAK